MLQANRAPAAPPLANASSGSVIPSSGSIAGIVTGGLACGLAAAVCVAVAVLRCRSRKRADRRAADPALVFMRSQLPGVHYENSSPEAEVPSSDYLQPVRRQTTIRWASDLEQPSERAKPATTPTKPALKRGTPETPPVTATTATASTMTTATVVAAAMPMDAVRARAQEAPAPTEAEAAVAALMQEEAEEQAMRAHQAEAAVAVLMQADAVVQAMRVEQAEEASAVVLLAEPKEHAPADGFAPSYSPIQRSRIQSIRARMRRTAQRQEEGGQRGRPSVEGDQSLST